MLQLVYGTPSANQIYEAEIYVGSSSQYFKINGTALRTQTQAISEQVSQYPVYLFDINVAGIYGHNFSHIKLYDCQIYVNDVLIKDLIPVLDKNNVPCLCDNLSDELLYNKGTGQFLYA